MVHAYSGFEKNVARTAPDWVRQVELPVPGSTRDRDTIRFVTVDDLPTLVWVANLAVVIRGSESIKHLEALAAPMLLIVAVGLLVWALPKISLGEVLATPATRPEGAPITTYFLSALTAMVGFWATLSLNIPDFSRYTRTQRQQVLGQLI